MKCEKPTLAWMDTRTLTKNGSFPIIFSPSEISSHVSPAVYAQLLDGRRVAGCRYKPVDIPCGHCLLCRQRRAFEIGVRAVCEQMSCGIQMSSFVTLTCDDEHLPDVFPGCRLSHRPFQLFMKRLRKCLGVPGIRYLMCGEYGETTHRPHYHVVIFGYSFTDSSFDERGCFHGSALLEELWPFGHVRVDSLNENRIFYVAGYQMKYDGNSEYEPYVRWSRRPGLGAFFFDKYYKEIYSRNVDWLRCYDGQLRKVVGWCRRLVVNNRLVSFGSRYFDTRLQLHSAELFDNIRRARQGRLLLDADTRKDERCALVDLRNRLEIISTKVASRKREPAMV